MVHGAWLCSHRWRDALGTYVGIGVGVCRRPAVLHVCADLRLRCLQQSEHGAVFRVVLRAAARDDAGAVRHHIHARQRVRGLGTDPSALAGENWPHPLKELRRCVREALEGEIQLLPTPSRSGHYSTTSPI
jgi:hypothetical protein